MKNLFFILFTTIASCLFSQSPPWMENDQFLDRLQKHISSLIETNSMMQSVSTDTNEKLQNFMSLHCKKMMVVKKIEKCLLMNFLEKEASSDDTYKQQLSLVQKMIQNAKYLQTHFDKTKSDELNQDYNEFRKLFSPKKEYPVRRPCTE